MARSNEAFDRFSALVRQAEAVGGGLDLRELLDALGDVERLKGFLWSRLNARTAPARPEVQCRLEVEEMVRALRSAVHPPEPVKVRTADGLLTVPQAAQLLGMSKATIRSWLSQRRFPAVKLGRAVRIKERDVRKLIEDGYVAAWPRP